MYSKKIVFALVSAALAALLAAPAMAEQLITALPDGSSLEMVLPATWKSTHETVGPSVTVRLSSAAAADFLVLITTLPVKAGSPASTPEGLRASVTELGNRSLSTSLQEHLELTEIKGQQAVGYLFHMTDRNPEKGPGDYREVHQGAILLGQQMITFTILTHPGDSATVDEAKRLLSAAKISSR
jgi:hypothetical protein